MFSFLDAFLSVFRRKQSLLPKKPVPVVPKVPGTGEPERVYLDDYVRSLRPRWIVQTVAHGQLVSRKVAAWTKSEARAVVKREFGLSRLPVGTIIQRKAA